MKIRLEGTAEELSRWLNAVEPKPQSGEGIQCFRCGKQIKVPSRKRYTSSWIFHCLSCSSQVIFKADYRAEAIRIYQGVCNESHLQSTEAILKQD